MEDGLPCEAWNRKEDVELAIDQHGPFDLLIVQHPRHCMSYRGIQSIKLPKIAILTDYFPWTYPQKHDFMSYNGIDLALFPEQYMIANAEHFKANLVLPKRLKTAWLPFWVDYEEYKGLAPGIQYDVTALFSGANSGVYPNRRAVIQALESLTDLTVFARLVTDGSNKVRGSRYPELLASSAIVVTSNDKFGSVNFKHFEIPAAAALMISDRALDFESLGFIAGEHYVEYSAPSELPGLIHHYLDYSTEAAWIAHQGHQLVSTRHTAKQRCAELFDIIGKSL